MRKLSVPIGLLIFFMTASPVFAASFWDTWNFSSFLNFFNLGTYRSASPPAEHPEGFSSFGQQTTPPPRPTKGAKPTYSLVPTGFGRPTDFVRPTHVPPTPQSFRATGARGPTESSSSAADAKTHRATVVQDVIGRMLDSYQKRLQRYSDFLTKVKARRDKLAADGKDVSKLDSFITTATDNWNSAQTVFTDAKAALSALDYTGDMGPLRQSIHDQLTKLRLAMTTLHKSMSQTVAAIIAATTSTSPSAGFENRKYPTDKIHPTPRANPGQGGGNH